MGGNVLQLPLPPMYKRDFGGGARKKYPAEPEPKIHRKAFNTLFKTENWPGASWADGNVAGMVRAGLERTDFSKHTNDANWDKPTRTAQPRHELYRVLRAAYSSFPLSVDFKICQLYKG